MSLVKRMGLPIMLAGSVMLGGCNTQGWKNLEKECENLFDPEKGIRFRKGGAATMSAMALGSMSGSAQDPRGGAGGQIASTILGNYGSAQANEPGNVNVYVQQPNHETNVQHTSYVQHNPHRAVFSTRGGFSRQDPHYGFVVIASCNESKDFDGDGTASFPDEFIGLKDTFYTDEELSLSLTSTEKFRNLKCIVIGPNEHQADSFSLDNLNSLEKEHYGLKMNYVQVGSSLGKGAHTAFWYSDGKPLGQLEFKIIERE